MEALQEVIVALPIYLELICQLIGAVAVFATTVVKLTPSKSDDKKVGKVVEKMWGLIDWLPTIGVNPRTKALKDAQLSLKQ